MEKVINSLPPLIPDKHPQSELFLCDSSDATIKDDQVSMEHPVFSLSKKPDMDIKLYEHNGNRMEVAPSAYGHATIYDKDILIYAVSKIMKAKSEGKEISKNVVFEAKDALIFMNRNIGGKDYRALEKSLMRLKGTMIKTDIKTGDEIQTDIFGLLDKAKIHRKHTDGRVMAWGVTLSDWLYNAVKANEVLTLHPDYFRLRRPIEKRIYELARKHCGNQDKWKISTKLLKKKSGMKIALNKKGEDTSLRKLRFIIRGIEKTDHLPDYSISIDDENDMVTFINKRKLIEVATATGSIKLKPETYQKAKEAAPLWDVYYLESAWRTWMTDGGLDAPKHPDGAFIGFCKRWYDRKGEP